MMVATEFPSAGQEFGNPAYGSRLKGMIRSAMNHMLSSLFLLCGLSAWAQTDHLPPRPVAIDTLTSNDGSLTRVENQPQFPGGEQALAEYMRTNVHYPEELQKARIAGTVKVAFTIADDGTVKDVRLQGGIPNGEALNQEAMRVVRAMPRWEPAHVYGVAVPMDYLLPVTFALQEQP
jgi:TonB family protein